MATRHVCSANATPESGAPRRKQKRHSCVSPRTRMARHEGTLLLNSPSSLASRHVRPGWRYSQLAVAITVGLTLFVDMVVYGVVVPILPVIASKTLDQNKSALGLLFGSYAFGLLACTPPIAYLSDRFHSRKLPMLAGLAALAITTIFFAFSVTFYQLLLARILQGVAAGASWTVGLSLLADVYPNDKLGSVMGPVLSCNHAGFLVGPIIGGWLYEYFSYSTPFYFCAGLAAVNFLVRLIVDESALISNKNRESILTDENVEIGESIVTLLDSPPIISIDLSIWQLLKGRPIVLNSLLTIIVGGIYAGLEPTLPLYLQATYNMTPGKIGTAFIALIVPSILTAPLAGILSDRYGGRGLILVSVLAMSIITPVVAQMPQLWSHLVALALMGGCQSFAMTPVVPAMAKYVNEQGSNSYAKVYGIFNLAYSAGILFGPPLAGVLYSTIGFTGQMAVFGAILFLLVICLFCYYPHSTIRSSNGLLT